LRRHPGNPVVHTVLPERGCVPARQLLALLIIFLITIPQLHAFHPSLNLISPRGGQLGTEVTVKLHGERLYAPEELLLYKPGITVKSLEKAGDEHKQARAVLVIAPDAELGEHPMRLRCKGGVTEMRTFWVGQFPTVMEEEPNDDFASPQVVPINSTVQGVADKEDADHYRVPAGKGQRLSVEVEGVRLGGPLFDPYVSILDKDRFELASADDTPLLRRDPCASVVVPEDGEYTILIRESSYEGKPNFRYRLHIGNFPRPVAVYPPGARPDEKRRVTFIGDAKGDQVAELTMPAGRDTHAAAVAEGPWRPPSGVPIRVSDIPYVDEQEPNEGTREASPAEAPPVPVAFHGILSKKEDKDWFRFQAKKGQRLRAQVFARALRSPLDSVIIIRNIKGGESLGYNDDPGQGTPDSRLDVTIPEDGTYLINIRDQLYRSGPDFTYRIEVAPRRPLLGATLPYAKRADSQLDKMICIPRGNRVARVINISRQNLGCDVALQASGLPAGVAADADTAPRALTSFPVVFEAAADAPVAGALCPLTVHDPKTGISGPVTETIHHIEVNNAGTYHSTSGDRHAIAVIEEAPYHLSLDVPPAPLVRNGTMNLKITANRSEGFTGKIRVTLPWKPPGIGAPPSVDIPKDGNEAYMRINANADAAIATWRICVQGEAYTPKGRVLCSSRLQPLEVAEPYLGMKIEMAATHPGEDTQLLCTLAQHKQFEGRAVLTLHGLPHGVSTTSCEISASDREVAFPLAVTRETRKGKHANIFCQAIVTVNGHPVAHTIGSGGTLRVDAPPPAPKKEPEKKPAATETPTPKKPAAKKPLSRLEQLRLQKKQK
jgi:hypothetical protein